MYFDKFFKLALCLKTLRVVLKNKIPQKWELGKASFMAKKVLIFQVYNYLLKVNMKKKFTTIKKLPIKQAVHKE